MKKSLIIIAGAMLLAQGAVARSPKRGVSENEFRYLPQAEALAPGVCWYYNWGNTPHESVADYGEMEYVPMCWNGNYNAQAIRDYCKAHPNVKYLLGFNEPNFTAQANLTPQEAAEKWPEVQALAKELGLKLVAPALNYSPNTWQPTPWMDEFVKLVGKDAFDYTAIHSYGGAGVMKTLATEFHERYGKPVWVTEFSYWPGEAGYVAPATQIASMMESVKWLEQTEWIYRYAWFKAVGSSESSTGPNYGLLKPGRGDDPRELSPQGYVYVYMTDFDTTVWHPAGEVVSAVDYVDYKSLVIGKGNLEGAPKPVEITQFNSAAWADYQFDVPQAGDYNLRLTVSGEGDPKRFDPCLAVYAVTPDGKKGALLSEQKQFPLSGYDNVYTTIDFPMTLEAGKQRIRLADMYEFQPSGLHIATLELVQGGLGAVQEMAVDEGEACYYSMQGLRIERPEPGQTVIRVCNGRASKVIF